MNYVYFILLVVLASCKMTNITNLDKWVEKQNYTMVFFTRDECNHCLRLEEELEKASDMINIGTPGSIPIPVVRLKNYELNRYPILRLYVKGLYTEHSGEWESKKLEQWADLRALSYISDSDSEPTIRWIHESHNISVLVFNKTFKDELKWLKALKYHIHFTYTTLPNAKQLLGVGEETTLVMFTDKGLNRYDYDGEITYEKVFKFVEEHEQKFYQELTSEAIEQIFYQPTKPILFIFDDRDYRETAKIYQKNINTVLVKQDQATDRLLDYLGIKGIQRPLAVIYDQNNQQKKYRIQFTEQGEVKKFISSFLNNKLEPYFKSQTPVKNENWEKQILTVVGDDLPKHEDIFIYFYAGWCKVCQKYTPIFEQLFSKYRGKRAFGRFDASENEVKDQFIKEVPMLRWYNSKQRQVVTFDGPFTIDALSEFVDKQGKKQISEDL